MSKKIAIVTDSNSGILPEELADKGVFIVPMPFLVNGDPYLENITLTQADFYNMLSKNASVSTSQPSIGDLTELWENILKEYDEIVHIPMSSALSQSCATATMLAKDFNGKVHVVDNRRISVILKCTIYDAIKLRDNGKSAAEIKETLEEMAGDASVYLAVDTMKYLKKGGRVTPAAAMIGSILKIKPILQLHGERLDKYALARSMPKAKEMMKEALKNDLSTFLAPYVEKGEVELYVAHTNNYQEAEIFVEEVKKDFPNISVAYCDPLALSVSCHVGPGCLAITASRVLK